ncbi:hypothetical protein QJ48_28830 [Paenibacillus sp. A3]|nr:hypothetical protein QJ48_28830 [Paenibacillus sp. A3]
MIQHGMTSKVKNRMLPLSSGPLWTSPKIHLYYKLPEFAKHWAIVTFFKHLLTHGTLGRDQT